MAKRKQKKSPTPAQIEHSIHVVRGQRVMLDADLAELYGATTSALNQAVGRNRDRLPDDISFLLTQQEVTNLRLQNVISRSLHGGRRSRPRVFTEQGVAMLSSVLRNPSLSPLGGLRGVKVNVEIMRTFVRLRRLMATPGELVEQLTKLAETVQLHDDQIKVITQVLQKILEQSAEPKRQIGFHTKGEHRDA